MDVARSELNSLTPLLHLSLLREASSPPPLSLRFTSPFPQFTCDHASSSVFCSPHVMVPRQQRETSGPPLPSLAYCIFGCLVTRTSAASSALLRFMIDMRWWWWWWWWSVYMYYDMIIIHLYHHHGRDGWNDKMTAEGWNASASVARLSSVSGAGQLVSQGRVRVRVRVRVWELGFAG